jgi:hypothetical protein
MVLGSIDVGLLFEVIWSAAIAGAFVSLLFSLVVLFGARAAENRRAGHGTVALAYGVGATLSFAAFAFLVGFALHIMLSKD